MPDPLPYDATKRIIESILFVADKPVDVSTLGRITGADPRWVDEILNALATEYQAGGLRVQRNGTAGGPRVYYAPTDAGAAFERSCVLRGTARTISGSVGDASAGR